MTRVIMLASSILALILVSSAAEARTAPSVANDTALAGSIEVPVLPGALRFAEAAADGEQRRAGRRAGRSGGRTATAAGRTGSSGRGVTQRRAVPRSRGTSVDRGRPVTSGQAVSRRGGRGRIVTRERSVTRGTTVNQGAARRAVPRSTVTRGGTRTFGVRGRGIDVRRRTNVIVNNRYYTNRYFGTRYYGRPYRSYYSPGFSLGLSYGYPYYGYGYGYGGYGYPYYGSSYYGSYGGRPYYGYNYGSSYVDYSADGWLRLKVRPRHADIFVDGYFVGVVDDYDGVFQRLRLTAGPHTIEIAAPGYAPLKFDVRILPDRKTVYEQDLLPLP